ncbi:MAG TPA: recombinase family protein [Microbacteriaceae bacterium]
METQQRPLALAYIRVSTTRQVEFGVSLEAQKTALIEEAERRGWDVEVVADEGLSGKSLNRPALQGALTRLDKGQAQFLMAIRLDRISRSVADFAGLVDRANKKKWNLVLLSPGVDTSDPAGQFTSNVLASAAQYERQLIGQRTREALAQKRLEGVTLGRPQMLSDRVVSQVLHLRAAGLSMAGIAAHLTELRVPTAKGRPVWSTSTIQAVLKSQKAAELVRDGLDAA